LFFGLEELSHTQWTCRSTTRSVDSHRRIFREFTFIITREDDLIILHCTAVQVPFRRVANNAAAWAYHNVIIVTSPLFRRWIHSNAKTVLSIHSVRISEKDIGEAIDNDDSCCDTLPCGGFTCTTSFFYEKKASLLLLYYDVLLLASQYNVQNDSHKLDKVDKPSHNFHVGIGTSFTPVSQTI